MLVLAEGSHVRGVPLLSTGATLWLSNMVIFGLWYWQLDRGGPERRLSGAAGPSRSPVSLRDRPPGAARTRLDARASSTTSSSRSTRRSRSAPPTRRPVTTRAKLLMMTQALLSLVTLVIVVARAVNILE